MKKVIGSFLLFAFLTSCSSAIEEKESEIVVIESQEKVDVPSEEEHVIVETEIISDSVIYKMINSSKLDTSFLTSNFQYYKFDSLTFKSNQVYKDSVNHLIFNYIKNVTDFESNDESPVYSKDYFLQCLKHFASFYEEEDAMFDMLWEFQSSIEIDESYPSFVQVIASSWSFTGGAHGNGHVTYHLKDKSNGKALKLEDLISNVSELTIIAEVYFRKEMNLQPEDDLNEIGFWFDEGKFELNENFYIENNAINFHYNTYEIASYADGETLVSIPLSKIEGLVKFKVE